MLSSDDYFLLGCVLIIAPFLVFLFYEIFNLGFNSEPYIASLVGTIGVLLLLVSIIR